MDIAPNSNEQCLEETLKAFDEVLGKLADAAKLSGDQYPFNNLVAQSTSKVNISLKNEAEIYGMSSFMYERLMAFSKKNPTKYKSLMTDRNCFFEGGSGYHRKQIVITTSKNDSRASSIPATHLGSIVVFQSCIAVIMHVSVLNVLRVTLKVAFIQKHQEY